MADTLPAFIEIVIICFSGLFLGSFATAIAYRESSGKTWVSVSPGKSDSWSKCPNCAHRLGIPDLVPVLSWLVLKGKCRHCSMPVSARYPVIELMCLLACMGLYAAYDFDVRLFPLLLLMPFLIALFWIDIDRMLLPNRLVAICFFLAALYVGYVFYDSEYNLSSVADHLAGMVAYPAIYGLAAFIITKILKKSALGMGDIKFLVPAGLLAGFQYLSVYLILSGLLGICTALFIRIWKDSDLFPFGPALILSLYITIFCRAFYF